MRDDRREKKEDWVRGVAGGGGTERKVEREKDKGNKTEEGERNRLEKRARERCARDHAAGAHTQDRQPRVVAGGVRRGGRGLLLTPWPAWEHSDFKGPLGADGV